MLDRIIIFFKKLFNFFDMVHKIKRKIKRWSSKNFIFIFFALFIIVALLLSR